MNGITQLLAEAISAFFIGHSLVGPDLPSMMGQLLGGEVESQIINGAPLEVNWKESGTAEGRDGRVWLRDHSVDALVMTERVPLEPTIRYHAPDRYLRRWMDLAATASPDAQPYLYETWHSLDSGSGREVQWDDKGHLPWRQRITDDLALWQGLADKANGRLPKGRKPIEVIPVGQGMGRLYDAIETGQVPGADSLRDFFSDDIHPNDLGFYYIALIQFAAITGRPAAGLPANLKGRDGRPLTAPSPGMATVLQRLADETVQSFRQGATAARP